MTDDTITTPDRDGAADPSTVAAPAATPADVADGTSPAGRVGTATGVVLVEEISIDGMCGVY